MRIIASALCPSASLASELPNTSVELPLSPLSFGLSSLMPVPIDNPLTRSKIELGRRLFFEQRLSRDGTVSCASCHHPDKQFTDGRAVPVGIGAQPGRRNVPALINSAYRHTLFWDGRASTLEEQALLPLTNPREMGHTLEGVVAALSHDPSYRGAFADTFGLEEITSGQIAQALASYQRTLVAGNSAYDHYEQFKDEAALSDAARRGLKLFRGKARCAPCHDGSMFTDQSFHNTGVSWGREPLDLGRYEHTGRDEDKGRFETPTLRSVTLTAPYMHDGSLATLADVIAFYDAGGRANPYLDASVRKLGLSAKDKADLIEFLKALTSHAKSGGIVFADEEVGSFLP